MELSEAVEAIISAKGMRSGIDNDSKDLIENNLIKEGVFEEALTGNVYYLIKAADFILRIKSNDFFDPKEFATLFLKEAEKNADDVYDYKDLIEVIICADDDEWQGGLNYQKWADQLLEHFFTLNPESADVMSIADLVKFDCNDENRAREISKKVEINKDEENMYQAIGTVRSLIDEYDDYETAKKIMQQSLDYKLEMDDEETAQMVEEAKRDLGMKQ